MVSSLLVRLWAQVWLPAAARGAVDLLAGGAAAAEGRPISRAAEPRGGGGNPKPRPGSRHKGHQKLHLVPCCKLSLANITQASHTCPL